MAKKTKKEKLIAEYRRKLSQISNPAASYNPSPVSQRYVLPEIKSSSSIVATSSLILPDSELLAIKKDLLITIILALAAFTLQLVIWKFVG